MLTFSPQGQIIAGSGSDQCMAQAPRVPAQVQWLASRSSAENPHELRSSFFQEAPKSPELTVQVPKSRRCKSTFEDLPVSKYTV